MITVIGYPVYLPEFLIFLGNPYGAFLVNLLAWAGITLLVYLLFTFLLRWVTRRLPGEIEDIVLDILRWPLIYLTMTYGIVASLEILPLRNEVVDILTKIYYTVLSLLVVHFLWRVVKDVFVYYGDSWARKTESRVDDILIPILKLLGPLVIIINAGFVILPIWGINIASVLVGAGVVGLIFGLALQDSLSNIFSGMSLLVEAPFKTGDLIILPDGRICEVERLGLRSTQFYSPDAHSTVFVPNKILAGSTITNITKPTVEQKMSIEISVGPEVNFENLRRELRTMTMTHPNVLVTDLNGKILLMNEYIQRKKRMAESFPAGSQQLEALQDELSLYQQAVRRLRREDKFNQAIKALEKSLKKLARSVHQRETSGLAKKELEEIQDCCIQPVEEKLAQVISNSEAWCNEPDPWIGTEENETVWQIWQNRNHHLKSKWDAWKKSFANPSKTIEYRLDDQVQACIDWINSEYKLLPEDWKNPDVSINKFDGESTILNLWFYIDNIRLEHYNRARRVTTEIAAAVKSRLKEIENGG